MAEVRSYNPTLRERMAAALMGDNASQPRRDFVSGLMGSTGLGSTGMGLADLTPLGVPMGVQEAHRAGDPQGMALAVAPFGAMMRGGRAVKQGMNRGQNIQPPLGAQPESTTPSVARSIAGEAPAMSIPDRITWDTFDNFLTKNKIPFERRGSTSISELHGPSASRYYKIETPTGPETIRVSDHSYTDRNKFDFRYGDNPSPAFDRLLQAMGRGVPPEIQTASRAAQLDRARRELSYARKNRYSEAVKFWNGEIDRLGKQ